VKLVTYWENVAGRHTPPHIETFLAIMSAKLSDRFLLLTNHNVVEYIGDAHLRKKWRFSKKDRPEDPVVARSDFIRFAYIHEHGGLWIDADFLCIGDPNVLLDLVMGTDTVLWDSEAIFGSRASRIGCFRGACDNMLARKHQIWGDPGGIKTCIDGMNTQEFPEHLTWPKPAHGYWWDKTAILLRTDIEPVDFLSGEQAVLHVFHSQSRFQDLDDLSLLAKLLRAARAPIPESEYELHANRVRQLIGGPSTRRRK